MNLSPSTIQEEQTSIIYVGDPMCSWCYGFAPEISKVKAAYPEHGFQLVMGGLRPNGNETMADLKDFLQHHWEDVSKASGQEFSYDILNDPTFIYDTEPSSRAVIVVRKMKPEIELDFFKAIQKAFYQENKNTTQLEVFLEIAEAFQLDQDRFTELYESEELIKETKGDFYTAQRMGVRGFPSLVLKQGKELTLISNGYQKAEAIQKIIDKELAE